MTKLELTNAMIALVDQVREVAKDIPLTRGDLQNLLVAGRHELAFGLVQHLLDPRAEHRDEDEFFTRVHALIDIAQAADIEVVRALLV